MSSSDLFDKDPYKSPQEINITTEPRKFGHGAQLKGTRTGLQLVYWGIVLMLVCFVLIIIGVVAMGALGGGGPGGGANQMLLGLGFIIIGLALMVGGLMMLIGQCFCLTVPEQTGAKGLITAVVAIQVINLVVGFGIGAAAAVNPQGGNPVLMGVQFLSGILGLVGFFCFLYFIKKVALYINQHEIAEYAGKVIGVCAAIVVMYVMMIAVAIASIVANAGAMAVFSGCLGLIILISCIVGLCMYTTVLRNTINALGEIIPPE